MPIFGDCERDLNLTMKMQPEFRGAIYRPATLEPKKNTPSSWSFMTTPQPAALHNTSR
jgi:hypothetical protein